MYRLKTLKEHINEDWFKNSHNWLILSKDERIEWMSEVFPKMSKSKIKKYAKLEWAELPNNPFKHSDIDVPYTKESKFN